MTYYPAAFAGQAVPADSTGAYPALAGYVPMDTGRRVAVALADGLIAGAVFALMALVAAGAGRNALVATVLPLVVSLAYAAASLWALFAKAARLAGLPLKAQFVDVNTGLPAGGKLFGKYLLQGLLSAVTFGLAPLIMFFVTVQEPLKRNWFDRALGLMLIDARTGRRPGDPLPAPPIAGQPPAVAPVQFPPLPGEGAGAPTWLASPPPPAPPVPPTTFAPPAVQPVVEPDGLITRTPRSGVEWAAPVEPPASFAPPVVVREMRSVDAAETDQTMRADEPGLGEEGGLRLFLDGAPLRLDPPTVLGRNPVAPGSHPDAVPRAVADRSASKTHLLVGRDDQGPWVIDLHSTNGVAVARGTGAASRRLLPGRKTHLAPGDTVTFAAHSITTR